MTEPNWKALAMNLARQVLDQSGNPLLDAEASVVLAAATPTEQPLPWPGAVNEPEIIRLECDLWRVSQWQKIEEVEYAVLGGSRAEAVAAWNRAVRAMSGGVNRETRSAIEWLCRLAEAGGYKNYNSVFNARTWLAKHPEPQP